jgi:tetratricopeptide (TPR) repeat protein
MAVNPAENPLALARRYLETGDARRALAALDRAPGALDDPDFWAVRAEALCGLDRYAEAAEAAQKGLEHDPDDFDLLDLLAISELERGREKEAMAAIDSALELYPDSAELHAHRALILARRKRKSFRLQTFKKARAALDEALRLDPQSEDVLRARAQVAALSGDPLGPKYAAELLALEPDDEQVHALTGTALANRGDVLPALRHFEEAARLDPSDPKLVWAGRYARELRRPMFAPALFLERITRGHVRIGWFVIAFPTLRLHILWLSALVFTFWMYMWAVHIYLHRRFGKEPE